jgi:hypothetical protein
MSGSVKSGLLFALIAIPAVVGFSFIPGIGALCCGPLGAMLLGGAAGFLAIRWSEPTAGVGSGVLAGGITGIGALIASIAFWWIAISLAQQMPGFEEQLEEALRQQPDSGMTIEQLTDLVNVIGPFMGLCVGIIVLLFTLGAGAIGAMIATRNRNSDMQSPMPPPPPPPMTPVN